MRSWNIAPWLALPTAKPYHPSAYSLPRSPDTADPDRRRV